MFTFQHTVKKSNTKISTYEIISLYLKIFIVISVLPIKFLICFGICSHYTKNHISQVLEYHEKFKNTKKISTFHQLFRSKKTVFPISEKFKTRIFPYSKNMIFHAEENIILRQLFEPKEDRISHL